MSRHRNVRSMNYEAEYEGYDDVYGHSVEDDLGVSPSASQYLYDRSKTQQPVSSFFKPEENIAEEEEEDTDDLCKKTRERLDSLTIETAVADLSPEDEIRLKKCLEQIHDVVGDSIPESVIISNILRFDFDADKALNSCLEGNTNVPLAAAVDGKPTKVAAMPKERVVSHKNAPKIDCTENSIHSKSNNSLVVDNNNHVINKDTVLNVDMKNLKLPQSMGIGNNTTTIQGSSTSTIITCNTGEENKTNNKSRNGKSLLFGNKNKEQPNSTESSMLEVVKKDKENLEVSTKSKINHLFAKETTQPVVVVSTNNIIGQSENNSTSITTTTTTSPPKTNLIKNSLFAPRDKLAKNPLLFTTQNSSSSSSASASTSIKNPLYRAPDSRIQNVLFRNKSGIGNQQDSLKRQMINVENNNVTTNHHTSELALLTHNNSTFNIDQSLSSSLTQNMDIGPGSKKCKLLEKSMEQKKKNMKSLFAHDIDNDDSISGNTIVIRKIEASPIGRHVGRRCLNPDPVAKYPNHRDTWKILTTVYKDRCFKFDTPSPDSVVRTQLEQKSLPLQQPPSSTNISPNTNSVNNTTTTSLKD